MEGGSNSFASSVSGIHEQELDWTLANDDAELDETDWTLA